MTVGFTLLHIGQSVLFVRLLDFWIEETKCREKDSNTMEDIKFEGKKVNKDCALLLR
jgi:hypothetical protein